MKLVRRILIVLFAVILLLVSLAFVFIEGALLVRGDWLLHEVPFFAFLQYFSRTALAVIGGVLSIRLLLRKTT